MSGLISPKETETQEFGLQLGNSSEFPADLYRRFRSLFESATATLALYNSNSFFLKQSILGGRIRSIRQSLSESVGRAGSSRRRPVRRSGVPEGPVCP